MVFYTCQCWVSIISLTLSKLNIMIISSYDEKTPGIAHLLEHVIVSSNTYPMEALTLNDRTEYTFRTNKDKFWERFSYWTKLMFSTSALNSINNKMKEIFDCECERVDGEFHESRGDVSINDKINEIIELKPRWSCGNLDTFKANNVTISELEDFRKLYRERPVFMCIQASLCLDKMEVNIFFSICTQYICCRCYFF